MYMETIGRKMAWYALLRSRRKLPSFVTKSLKYQYKEFRGSSFAAPARYGSGDEMPAMLVVSC
jgi:hypothetical protein